MSPRRRGIKPLDKNTNFFDETKICLIAIRSHNPKGEKKKESN